MQVDEQLAALPPEVDNPVEWLHTTIGALHKAVEDKMSKCKDGTSALYEPQKRLGDELRASVPEFVPFTRGADEEKVSAYTGPKCPLWPSSNDNRIYYDDVEAMLDQ